MREINNYFPTKLFYNFCILNINQKAKDVWNAKNHCQHKILRKGHWANKLVIYKIGTLPGLLRLEIIIKEHVFIDFPSNL